MQFIPAFKHDGIFLYARNVLKIYYIAVIAARKQSRVQLFFQIFQRAAEIYRLAVGMHVHIVHNYFYIEYGVEVYSSEHPRRLYPYIVLGASVMRAANLIHLERKVEVSHGLYDKVHGVYFIALNSKLRHVGNKNQNHVLIYLSEFFSGLHAVYKRHFYVHEDGVEPGSVARYEFQTVRKCDHLAFDAALLRVPRYVAAEQVGLFGFIFHYCNFKHQIAPVKNNGIKIQCRVRGVATYVACKRLNICCLYTLF